MRFSFSLICVAAVVIAVHTTNPEELNYNSNNRHQQQDRILEPLNVPVDRETIAYLLPRLAAKYRPNSEWTDVKDPRFYVLTDMDNDSYDDQMEMANARPKRHNFENFLQSHLKYAPIKKVLSIDAPVDILQNLYKHNQYKQQIERNRARLMSVQ